jgi:methyl-accepting chemotaxis protein
MNNIKIGPRLALGFGMVIFMLVTVATLGISRLASGSAAVDSIINKTYVKVAAISDIKNNSDAGARSLRNAMLATTPGDKEQFIADMAQSGKKAAAGIDRLEKLLILPKDRELFKSMADALAQYVAVRSTLNAMIRDGQTDQATGLLFNKVIPAYRVYAGSVDAMVAFQRELMDREGQAALAQASAATTSMTVLSVIAAALAVFLAVYISRSIVRPLHEAMAVAQEVAAGDLTRRVEVRSKDETGQLMLALRNMNDGLAKIVSEVRASSDTIATASSQIAAGNFDLSSRTEEQASSLEETAASMEELTSTVKQNADNARQGNRLAMTASEVAVKGGSVMSEVIATMGAINDSSKKIVDIISVIDGIAFQTNILSLNAAVEAARAGEQGRGFAVVASEVRSLAQRSSLAAKEIKELIGDSVGRVEAGAKLVEQAGATMDEVVNSVRRVTDIMAEITAASQEQSAGIEQVNVAIAQMDQVTQQNAALVEEASAAAESMQQQAAGLSEVVSVFKVNGKQQPAVAALSAKRQLMLH